jgi:hypothetical protein
MVPTARALQTAHMNKPDASNGPDDNDYTWGRPVTAYVSTLDHMRLLLYKARRSALNRSQQVDLDGFDIHPHCTQKGLGQ